MKFPDWENRLIEYLRSISRKPFAWGEHDCFIFTLSCVRVITGQDYVTPVMGQYNDEQSSKEFCHRNGYRSHIHFISKTFKKRQSLFHAMRGDIIVMQGGALGICQGPHIYGIGNQGIYSVPMITARKAFEL